MSPHNVFKKNGVVNRTDVVVNQFRFKAKVVDGGKTAEPEVVDQFGCVVLSVVAPELKILAKAQRIDGELDISSGKTGGQFRRKQVGVGTRKQHIHIASPRQ